MSSHAGESANTAGQSASASAKGGATTKDSDARSDADTDGESGGSSSSDDDPDIKAYGLFETVTTPRDLEHRLVKTTFPSPCGDGELAYYGGVPEKMMMRFLPWRCGPNALCDDDDVQATQIHVERLEIVKHPSNGTMKKAVVLHQSKTEVSENIPTDRSDASGDIQAVAILPVRKSSASIRSLRLLRHPFGWCGSGGRGHWQEHAADSDDNVT
ncbi:hypothetical protein BJV78DRAFT_1154951 [Lactifluus subvellereus]|nr:hypothetical protein BJV78DRAFT_1154951 [Lactifluus subvellereus]